MKIALDWIAEYLDRPVAPQEAENALLNAGLPIESVAPVANTHVLDVEVTSNRSDCLSHVGLARELAALLGRNFRLPPTHLPQETGPAAHLASSVTIQDPQACPYYSARIITGVKVQPSPAWLVNRLESLGLRPVNNIVDVTNYVLFELGQPLHAFDFDTLHGRKIIVRRARPGEKIVSIDGKTNALDPSMLVIADAENPVAVAGVMGGKATEVGDHTVTILLESACFDSQVVRAQARALSLMSDASYRFERGIDPQMAELASRRAAQLIVHLAGGVVHTGLLSAGSAHRDPIQIELRVRRIAEVLGISIDIHRVLSILSALQFAPELHADGAIVRCYVPSHRLDVDREIDLIEEIARVYGYAHIQPHDRVSHPVQPEPTDEKAGRTIRQTLIATGFSEAVTVTFIPREQAQPFLPPSEGTLIAPNHAGWKTDVLRPSLFPSLLQVRRTNQNAGIPDARLFEHAEAFWQKGDAKTHPPTQYRLLTLVGNDVSELRGALETLLFRLNADAKLIAQPHDLPWFAPGVSAKLLLSLAGKETELGSLGQFNADLQKAYDLRHPAAGAEVFWDTLLEAFQPVRTAKPLPKFPGIRRDLSVVLDESVRWSDLEAAIRAAHLPFLESVDFVVTFRNKQIGPAKKSLTLTLEFRDPNATLRSEQVDAQMKTALDVLAAQFAAVLRT